MDVFIVMEFIPCDDPCYGYGEYLRSVCGSIDEAKAMLETTLQDYAVFGKYGVDGSFLQIIRMQMGNTKKEVIYDTQNDKLYTLVDTGNNDIYDEDDDLSVDTKLDQATMDVEKNTSDVEILTDENNMVELFHSLKAFHIGNSADIDALNQIFPQCKRNNFEIETMAELKVFLDNINKRNDLVSSGQKTSWCKLSPKERAGIKKRYADMIILHPGLISSIQLLKKQWLQTSVKYWTGLLH